MFDVLVVWFGLVVVCLLSVVCGELLEPLLVVVFCSCCGGIVSWCCW